MLLLQFFSNTLIEAVPEERTFVVYWINDSYMSVCGVGLDGGKPKVSCQLVIDVNEGMDG